MKTVEEVITLEGYFRVKYIDKNSRVPVQTEIIHHEEKNIIVNNARKILSHSIGDDTSNKITSLKIGGDNSLSSSEQLNPNTPQLGDTDILYTTHTFTRSRGDTIPSGTSAFQVIYPNSPNEVSVLFKIIIDDSEANLVGGSPTVFVSAGLFSSLGLFSSKTYPVITKIPTRTLIYEWEIKF